MSVWISGAVTTNGPFKNHDDWEIFDELEKELSKLAKKHNVFIERRSINDGDYAFTIANKKMKFEALYESSCFDPEDFDLDVSPTPDFEKNVENFIKALNKDKKFVAFHDLDWDEIKGRYYTIS